MFSVYILFVCFNLYFMLLYLQESHYHFSGYKLILKKALRDKYTYLLLIPLFSILYKSWIIDISVIMIFLIYVLFKLKQKLIVKLKFTPRIIRFILINIILNIIMIYLLNNIKLNSLVNLDLLIIYLSILVLFISHIILLPIEYLINKYFIYKAKNKIKRINPIVIGITGSAGKTSCKNFLYQIIRDKYIAFMTQKSYNTVMGISRSINETMHELTEIAIIEYGASHKNDIKKSLEIVKPNLSLITNIGLQHLETFKSEENIIKEKCLLMKNSNVHFYNKLSNYKLEGCNEYISFSKEKGADYYLKSVNYYKDKTIFIINDKGKEITFETKLLGENNIINIISCIAICRYLGLEYKYIKDKVKKLKSVNSRLEVINKHNKVIINDSFNSNKNGFVEAINVLNLFDKKRVIITPGIVTGGKEINIINEEVAYKIVSSVDYCYLVESVASDIIKKVFDDNNYNYLLVDSFESAYNKALKDIDTSSILIENDITDIYRRI